MEDADDPFDAFGEDDDDEGEEETPSVNDRVSSAAASVARSLVDAANLRITTSKASPAPTDPRGSCHTPAERLVAQQGGELDLTHVQLLDSPWPKPLYVGPVLLVSSLPVGGGRGYVASRNIPAGTLILVEEPMMKWPKDQLGTKLGLASVRYIVERPDAAQLLRDLEFFHPTKANVDFLLSRDDDDGGGDDDQNQQQVTNMMKMLKNEYYASSEDDEHDVRRQKQEERQHLEDIIRRAGSRGMDLSTTDVLRLLLALRYNGLESGVYRHVAMLNHDDGFNCAKLLPPDGRPYSEVRTTRSVLAGESLTISYLPRVMSHASRRRYLWEQHRFDIGASHLRGGRLKMELVGHSLPPSPIHGGWDDDQSLTFRIETATEELEKMHTELAASISAGSPEGFETAQALEQSTLELYAESKEQLNNSNHVLLVPILTLHLEACALVLKDQSLSNPIQLGVLSRQANSAYHLLPLQQGLLGMDHFDLARTHLDLANIVSELLSRSPKKLYELNLTPMGSFAEWSALEHKSRKEYNRIKDLYPHDAEELMSSSSKQ
jgi:hypothetical protein